jgi:hypothetical protein
VVEQDDLKEIGLVLDARVSLLGLSAAVDDLSLTYVVASSASAFDPSRWEVDLAGFAVTADLAGLTLAGGLRKFPVAAGGSEYLGMLLARFAVYGVTVYGGYGLVGPPEDRFASLFLFGAVNGPIGGPPAFFITGIGGGIGINRGLVVPTDLSRFGDYPFIKALDPAARPGDPMARSSRCAATSLRSAAASGSPRACHSTASRSSTALRSSPCKWATDWRSPCSDSRAHALPRPEIALVSFELALVVRFSTREGLLLVQAQLTDNSWLLHPSVRLTGGFASPRGSPGPTGASSCSRSAATTRPSTATATRSSRGWASSGGSVRSRSVAARSSR